MHKYIYIDVQDKYSMRIKEKKYTQYTLSEKCTK